VLQVLGSDGDVELEQRVLIEHHRRLFESARQRRHRAGSASGRSGSARSRSASSSGQYTEAPRGEPGVAAGSRTDCNRQRQHFRRAYATNSRKASPAHPLKLARFPAPYHSGPGSPASTPRMELGWSQCDTSLGSLGFPLACCSALQPRAAAVRSSRATRRMPASRGARAALGSRASNSTRAAVNYPTVAAASWPAAPAPRTKTASAMALPGSAAACH
jgi:hypothetical protein